MTSDITALSVQQARTALDDGSITARALAEAYLKEIEHTDGNVGAYLEVFDDVLTQADEADRRIKEGTQSTLTGIPVAVKDNILISGRKASAASKILEGYTATYDAHVITALKTHGAVFMGRTNMDEFAMGSSTEHSAFGVTKNPHDLARVPGGSSGGSAAAVSAGGALVALGSDTGGSIRQPAAFCGVTGLKPTYGSVSRSGVIAMGSSLDQIGPLGKTVSDTAALYRAILGTDKNDSTSQSVNNTPSSSWQPLTIGVPENFIYREGVDDAVQKNFRETLSQLEAMGHTIVPVDVAALSSGLGTYYVVMAAEASTNLARFDGIRYGPRIEGETLLEGYKRTRALFGEEVRRRILMGTYVLSAGYYDAYYGKATRVREKIRQELKEMFSDVHVIVTPTTPAPAFKRGEKTSPLSMYVADIFTVSANLSGVPALSVPSGTVSVEGKELPLGFHIMAPWNREDVAFLLGEDVEKINT